MLMEGYFILFAVCLCLSCSTGDEDHPRGDEKLPDSYHLGLWTLRLQVWQ